MTEPFPPPNDPARAEAYKRLLAAAKRAGFSLDRLHQLLERVLTNESETRRFLAEEVYDVPEDLLDDLLRVRLADRRDDREDSRDD